MPRVKRGTTAHRKRERLLKTTKGYRWGRKSKKRAAREATLHAWPRAFRGRKEKKRNYRTLWNVRVNAASRLEGITYSKLIAALKKKHIALDRKILADLAANEPAIFTKIVQEALK